MGFEAEIGLSSVINLRSASESESDFESESATELGMAAAAILESALFRQVSGLDALGLASAMERRFRSIPAPTNRRLFLHQRK